MELLLFKPTEKEVYALNVHKVREVLNTPAITRVPNAGEAVVGMISIRGDIIPVVDLASKLTLSSGTEIEGSLCIIVECMRKTVALLVQDVHRIISVEASEMQDVAERGLQGAYIEAIIKTKENDRIVAVLDLEALFIESWGTDIGSETTNADIPEHLEKRIILCVDDSAVARKSLHEALSKLGFEVEVLSSAKDAISKASCSDSDLAFKYLVWLIDAEMPGMDGFELIQKLKTIRQAESLPLVMLTSMSGDAIVEKSKRSGAEACLVKFDIPALVSKLNVWMRQ